jgi:filamentous hemagglutinin family protein
MVSTKRANVRAAGQSTFSLRPAAIAVAVASCFASGAALANPTGAAVVNGQVTINQAGNLLSITNSPNSIINWQSFSIGANEITRFTQQSALSAVLNRVVGAGGSIDPSVILGALQSNGRVFLLNPSGIVFGAGSQIDVAGLVASSLNLSNADFLGGRLRFTEVPGAGAVVNQGTIYAASGGQVYLVGPSVMNSGIITSPRGEVILAAGNSVELVNPGTPNLRVEITAPDNEAKNLGSIVADAGRVGIYAGLINHSGTIRADSAVATADGRIILKATKDVNLAAGSVTTANGPAGGRIEINAGDTALVAGTVEAKGTSGQGGVVHVLGDKVGIYGNARVDVSGETGGGTVLAGGEFQGQPGVTAVEGAAIRNATSTFFGSDASIAADAGASGDGGKVIVWSDDTTRSYGAISARGGAAAGNGGLVETSGKNGLEVTRGPDVRAPNGLGGTWLIDPDNLEVVAGAEITNNMAQPLFSTLGGSSRIGVDLINLQLNFGSNVTLSTAPQGPTDSGQPGNITISAPILKSASTQFAQDGTTVVGPTIGTTSLAVQAHNNIVINPGGSITSTGDRLDVSLAANLFNPGTGTGGVTVNDAILTNGGVLAISGRGDIAINAPMSTQRTIGTGSGSTMSLASSNGAVNVNAQVGSGSSFNASGSTGVSINAPAGSLGSMSLSSANGAVNVGAATTNQSAFFASGKTGVNIGAPVQSVGSITLDSSSGMVAVNAAMTSGSFFSATGTTGVNIGGQVTSGSSIFLGSSNGMVNVGAPMSGTFFQADGFAGVSINAPVQSGSGSVQLFSDNGPITVAGQITGGFFDAEAYAPGALLTIGAPVTSTGAFLFADNMNIAAPLNAGSGTIQVQPVNGVPMNLGTETIGSLSLTQAEHSNLVTTGAKFFGSSNTGAITVSNNITGSSLLGPDFGHVDHRKCGHYRPVGYPSDR